MKYAEIKIYKKKYNLKIENTFNRNYAMYKDVTARAVHITSISHLLDWLYICVCMLFCLPTTFAFLMSYGCSLLSLEMGQAMCRQCEYEKNRARSKGMRGVSECFLVVSCVVDGAVVAAILCHNLTVLQQQHMPKLLNKSQNLKFYRYNSIHKSFEVFHNFCHPRHSHTQTQYARHFGCRYFMLWFSNIFQTTTFSFVRFITNSISVILI